MSLRNDMAVPALLVAAAVSVASCSRSEPRPAWSASPSAPAPDQVGSAEVMVGKETAFGLPLPEGFRIVQQTPYSIRAIGRISSAGLVDFVRDRVDASVGSSNGKTIFKKAMLRPPAENLQGPLRIEIDSHPPTCTIEVWAPEKDAPSGKAALHDGPRVPPSNMPTSAPSTQPAGGR